MEVGGGVLAREPLLSRPLASGLSSQHRKSDPARGGSRAVYNACLLFADLGCSSPRSARSKRPERWRRARALLKESTSKGRWDSNSANLTPEASPLVARCRCQCREPPLVCSSRGRSLRLPAALHASLPAPPFAHPERLGVLLGGADAVAPTAAARPHAGGAHRTALRAAEPAQGLAVLRAEPARVGLGPGLGPRPRALRRHGRGSAGRRRLHLRRWLRGGAGLPALPADVA